jgi:hypothetical protein
MVMRSVVGLTATHPPSKSRFHTPFSCRRAGPLGLPSGTSCQVDQSARR